MLPNALCASCLIAFVALLLTACRPVPDVALRDSVLAIDAPTSKAAAPTLKSGFPEYPGRSLVIAHCTGCHSGKLVQQNRASREGWQSMIRWMQSKQGLWQLDGETEAILLSYLTAVYGPEQDAANTRRLPLAAALLPPLIPPLIPPQRNAP